MSFLSIVVGRMRVRSGDRPMMWGAPEVLRPARPGQLALHLLRMRYPPSSVPWGTIVADGGEQAQTAALSIGSAQTLVIREARHCLNMIDHVTSPEQ
jgi:hypothetical protein